MLPQPRKRFAVDDFTVAVGHPHNLCDLFQLKIMIIMQDNQVPFARRKLFQSRGKFLQGLLFKDSRESILRHRVFLPQLFMHFADPEIIDQRIPRNRIHPGRYRSFVLVKRGEFLKHFQKDGGEKILGIRTAADLAENIMHHLFAVILIDLVICQGLFHSISFLSGSGAEFACQISGIPAALI